MQLFAKAGKDPKTLEMLRRFIANIADKEAGVWLVTRKRKVGLFLESQMDLLTTEERLKVYGFMEGMFPEHFSRVLAIRLQSESDTKCLEQLRAISSLHTKSNL